MAKGCLLSYLDPSIPHGIKTNASDYQIGAVIKQNGQPVAYFSRKLRNAQLNYTTIEKETLSIVVIHFICLVCTFVLTLRSLRYAS
jgi:Trk-type K+ transport system membrane component